MRENQVKRPEIKEIFLPEKVRGEKKGTEERYETDEL